jgi:hypothetical protein
MSYRPSMSVRLGVESLADRLVPSVTFQEDTAAHTLTLTAAQHQNNTVAITNDGNGGLRVTADGVTRTFTGVTFVAVFTGDGADTVTYTQGSATHEVDIRRNFGLQVHLGDNASGTTDRFTANVFGDVGFFQNGAWRARTLGLIVNGDGGHDRIAVNANHDTDVRPGSILFISLEGNEGNDYITADYDGELDGKLDFLATGDQDNDLIAANFHLDAGSSGSVISTDDTSGAAGVEGNLGNDNLTFAVRLAAGATAQVNAFIDGGFNLFDHDVGHRTANVRSAFLETDFVIQ